ncbi:MAG: asparagine--tRNA ligase [bacterium]
MARIRVREALKRPPGPEPVTVKGWLRTKRESKAGFSFLAVNDGSSMANLQVLADKALPNYAEIQRLTAGCSIEAEGPIVESPGREQAVELRAARLRVIGWLDPEQYPLQKKHHSFEFLREIAHLRGRTNTFGAVFRVRNVLARAVHDFFQERGFLYIQTPLITASDCEGAGQLFRVTTLGAEALKVESGSRCESPCGSQPGSQEDFFGKPAFLTVSGQLEAEALACGLGDVYTFGPTFRAENSNTPRHLAEFWMVEPEMVFCDLEGDMEVAEAFLKHLLGAALSECAEDMAFFEERIQPGIREALEKVVRTPFRRVSYTEAIGILQRSGEAFAFPVEWGLDLQTEHERHLTEQVFEGPVIVYDYPRSIKPFYMFLNDDDKTVGAMDVLVPRTGEIIGGSQREHREEGLAQRIAEAGLNLPSYRWYLDLRRFGTVPHAGFGLGFERLVQYVTGMANIRDVIPFPRTPGNAEF